MMQHLNRKIKKKIIRNKARNKNRKSCFDRENYSFIDWLIISVFFITENMLSSNRLRNISKYSNVCDYLKRRFDEFSSYSETLYRIKNHIDILPICKICGAKLSYKGNGKYGTYCSQKCKSKDIVKGRKLTKESILKMKSTCMSKYGSTSYLTSNEFLNKRKQKLGVSYPFQNKTILEKCSKSIKDKYDVDNAAKSIKIKNKIKSTCIERYGVDSYSKTNEFKNKLKEHKDEANLKRNNTKKINNSFNASKQEDRIYDILCSQFSLDDVIREYKSVEYPFNCDFYIKSLNLYIECNFHWTHGGHAYDSENLEDLAIIEKWKSKQLKYYNNAITTWTVRDVRKRNIAKKNKLNYIEFFDFNKAKESCQNIKFQQLSGKLNI